ncbi:hypothetical protein M406DRAFT_227067, partial [Cryphonectria parasitica EP155]
ITPYLGLRARLSQVPINRWTVLLLLVLVRMLILFAQLNTNLVSAQQEATAACSKVEDIGSTLASMPHYLSAGVNKLVAGGVTDTVRGLVKLLIMIVNAVMQTIMFFINFEYGTIACVADDFIHGLITVASDTIGALLKELSEGLKDIANGLSSAVSGVDDAIKGIENTVNSIPFAPHIDWPDLDALDSGIASLKNYQGIDANQTVAAINRFNQTVPDFDQLETDVQSVINIPFKAVELLLNESIGNWTMDPSVFPTASKQTLTFCTGNDVLTQFFEALFTVVKDAKTIAIVSLILAAILAAVVMAWWEVKRYHRSVAMAQTTLHRREPMDIVYIASRPLTARTGLWIAEKVSADPRRQMLIRWCIAYATTYTALFVLSLAVAGALSVLCQFLVMRAVQKEAPALTQVGGFVTEVIDRLEGISTSWANESNQAIASFQDDINGKVLVYVSNATDAVVNVINVFENKTEQILGEALGTVPQLENFANGLLDCILIDKLDEVKDGMEWIHQHAQVSFPAFPTDIFSLGITANSSSAGDNSSVFSLLASSGNNTADDITGAVDKVVTALRTSIITEGLIALVLMLIYIAYVFFAVAQA